MRRAERTTDAEMRLEDKQAVRQALISIMAEAATENTENRPAGDRNRNDGTVRIDLLAFFLMLLERLWLIVIAAIVGATVAWFYVESQEPTYSATAKMYIVGADDALINMSAIQTGRALTMDYQEVFKTWEVHEMVRADLGLDYTYSQMQRMLSISNPSDTRIMAITVTNNDPQLAADIANAYVRAAKTFIVESMRSDSPSDFSIALVPGVPVGGGKMRTILVGFLLGSMLVVGILLIRFLLDDRPKTTDDIMEYGGIPTLAILPAAEEKKGKRKKADGSQGVRA